MKTLDWDHTNFLIDVIKQEFVRQHDKPKDLKDEQSLVALRRLAISLNYRRIDILQLKYKKLKND